MTENLVSDTPHRVGRKKRWWLSLLLAIRRPIRSSEGARRHHALEGLNVHEIRRHMVFLVGTWGYRGGNAPYMGRRRGISNHNFVIDFGSSSFSSVFLNMVRAAVWYTMTPSGFI